MSYILEALKKSEQQRRQGPVPDLQTVHLATPDAPGQQSWPYVVIVLLLVSLAFILGWLQPWKTPPAQDVTDETAAAIVPPPADSLAARTAPPVQAVPEAESTAVRETVSASATARVVAEPVSEPPSLEIQAVPHLSELPDLVQQAIPDMSFAGHVYSSSAEQRSVIINGRSMAEGDTVIRDLSIEQITSDGIIFNYKGQLFRMEILQDWSFEY
jgi:general secretion pathway protein B